MSRYGLLWRRNSRTGVMGAALTLLLCLLALGGCGMKPDIRTVADNLRIGPDWTELRPDPPLEVRERIQRIAIEVPGAAEWDIRPDTASFVTPAGQTVKVEVELVAADVSRFTLDSVGIGPGLTFSHLPADPDPTGSRLPPDRRFPTVRLRSDRPLEAARVSWICITNY